MRIRAWTWKVGSRSRRCDAIAIAIKDIITAAKTVHLAQTDELHSRFGALFDSLNPGHYISCLRRYMFQFSYRTLWPLTSHTIVSGRSATFELKFIFFSLLPLSLILVGADALTCTALSSVPSLCPLYPPCVKEYNIRSKTGACHRNKCDLVEEKRNERNYKKNRRKFRERNSSKPLNVKKNNVK